MLSLICILIGTLLALANHSGLSMLYLNDLHAVATPAEQAQLVAAGEAILAGNMWHTSAGFVAGLFMQGGFAFISFVMLGSKSFSKYTAYTGILSNGLDFIHIPLMLFAPSFAAAVLAVGGIFYLLWFPLLGRDLYRLGKG